MTSRFDLGFLGGGQLARMSIQAAQRMGLSCVSLDPGEVTPASQVAPAIRGALSDPKRIAELLSRCERATLENEFIPAAAIREGCRLAGFPVESIVPSIQALETIQDKLSQREALYRAGVPAPKAVALEPDAERAIAEVGFPMVLKARFGGYDGKGTRYARDRDELEDHRSLWGEGGWLAEEFVPFRRELAAMVYLSPYGDGVFPTMETVQRDHVCDLVYPSDTDASEIALQAAKAAASPTHFPCFGPLPSEQSPPACGLFGIELFQLEDGRSLVNEIAPRPHNTGHYTLDWGGVSQFEQHVRVVMGFPPIEPEGRPTCMANLLGLEAVGDWRDGLRAALQVSGVRVHWYGKAESRPGRKMGHINAVGPGCVERAIEARERFYRAWARV